MALPWMILPCRYLIARADAVAHHDPTVSSVVDVFGGTFDPVSPWQDLGLTRYSRIAWPICAIAFMEVRPGMEMVRERPRAAYMLAAVAPYKDTVIGSAQRVYDAQFTFSTDCTVTVEWQSERPLTLVAAAIPSWLPARS